MATKPKKFGDFDVEEDGALSLAGITKFPVYSITGRLSMETVSYRWHEGGIIETWTSEIGTRETQIRDFKRGD